MKTYKVELFIKNELLTVGKCFINVESERTNITTIRDIATTQATDQIRQIKFNPFLRCVSGRITELTELNYPLNQIYF